MVIFKILHPCGRLGAPFFKVLVSRVCCQSHRFDSGKHKMFFGGARCTIILFLIGAFVQILKICFCYQVVRSCTNKKHKTI